MVYVDDYNAPFGRMLMCHMIADTNAELLAMVDKIGVQRKWIQYPGTYNEHFDICLSKKKIAVAHGAKEITARKYASMVTDRCDHVFVPATARSNKEICQKCGTYKT